MARSRILKPSFFTNDRLAELPAHARLLFAGLWTIADREGRLEDRGKRIKGELFPYENVRIEQLLQMLADAGFIVRYESGGERFIALPAFAKHQSPHVREPASTIPAPDEHQTGPVLEHDPVVPSTPSRAQDPVSLSVSLSDPVALSLSEADASGERAPEEVPVLPMPVREMKASVLGGLGRFGYDTEMEAEAELFARDFAGMWDEYNHALAEVRRDGQKPFPGNLRRYMPGPNGAARHGGSNGSPLRKTNGTGNGARRPSGDISNEERKRQFEAVFGPVDA